MWALIAIGLIASVIVVGGNNTGTGFGEDLERTGEKISENR